MKTFLFKLVIFSLVTFAAFAFVCFGVVYLNKLGLRNCVISAENTSIMIGDSHTMWAIDDRKIPEFRNISFNAEGYKYSYLKLEFLINSGHSIDTLYLGYSYHNFSSYYDEYIDGSLFKLFMNRYLSVLSWNDYLAMLTKDAESSISIVKEIIRRGWKSGLKQECTLFGSFPAEKKNGSFKHTSTLKRINTQFYRGGEVLPLSESNVFYLNKIIELADQNGIEVVLVSTPLHPEYEELIPGPYRKLFKKFASDNHLEIYAFSDLMLSDNDFLPDGDHTNYQGSMKTTDHFKEYYETR